MAPYASIAHAIVAHAQAQPSDVAVRFVGVGGEDLSFGGLDRRARTIACRLLGVVSRGDVVLLPIRSDAASVAGLVGCFYAGVVCAPAPIPGRGSSPDRLVAYAKASGAKTILCAADTSHLGAELPDLNWLPIEEAGEPAAVHADLAPPCGAEVALVQFTSGSTRFPKGVRLTHANIVANLEMLRRAFQVDGESRFASWLPLFHDMGLAMLLMPLYFGVPGALTPPLSFIRRPVRWLQMVQQFEATITGAPNFAFELCARRVGDGDLASLDLSGCKLAFCGAEPVRRSTMRRFTQRFAGSGFRPGALYPCYGMAEAVTFVSGGFLAASALRLDEGAGDDAPVSCGAPAEGSRVVIVDPQTLDPCAEQQEGEVWIAGPHVASGYWDPSQDASAFGAVLADEPGRAFLRTGDLGRLSGGDLTITGRLKDVIIYRGANLHAVDLEETVAASHPAFSKVGASFGWTADGEERVVHLQELARGASQHEFAALRQAAVDAVALQHGVRLFDLVLLRPGGIPKTTSGKVRRELCRRLYAQGVLANLDLGLRAFDGAGQL